MWQRIIREWDWILVLATMSLIVIGCVVIGSATHVNREGLHITGLVSKQLLFFGLNIIAIVGLQWLDYERLRPYAKWIYGATIVMLLAVMVVGTSALGAQRWIQIGPITIQPSEFTKLMMIISLANMLESRVGKLNTFKELLPVFLFLGIPAFLVFKQPDLGTSLVYVAILAGMLFVSGIRMRLVQIMVGTVVALLPLSWFVLQEYQKQRIMVFLNPNVDPFGAGYHIIQSKIAIGSGLLLGKGLFEGTQSQLNFLPENHTDFIFSVVGEELGLLGCFLVLGLLLVVVYRSFLIAKRSVDPFGMLIATGIGSMLLFEVLVNVGMTTGIMPVTGIPLPFISYGVSALTTNLLSIGLLLNIVMRQKKRMF